MKRITAAIVVVVGLACSSCIFVAPAPAPEGLEDLARFIWDRFDIKADTDVGVQDHELHEAVINLDKELADLLLFEPADFRNPSKAWRIDQIASGSPRAWWPETLFIAP